MTASRIQKQHSDVYVLELLGNFRPVVAYIKLCSEVENDALGVNVVFDLDVLKLFEYFGLCAAYNTYVKALFGHLVTYF